MGPRGFEPIAVHFLVPLSGTQLKGRILTSKRVYRQRIKIESPPFTHKKLHCLKSCILSLQSLQIDGTGREKPLQCQIPKPI